MYGGSVLAVASLADDHGFRELEQLGHGNTPLNGRLRRLSAGLLDQQQVGALQVLQGLTLLGLRLADDVETL
jgi:hypothetical protein